MNRMDNVASFELVRELVARTRSVRRFLENEPIARDTLVALLDLARLGGSARNLQPLKYLISSDPATCQRIFPFLGWAGYLTDWPGPGEGERPPAYVVCLLDTRIAHHADVDLGIATQNLLLGATALGLAGCRIANIRPGLARELGLPEHLKVLLVVALGKPAEEVRIEPVAESGEIRYWREGSIHHLPKRSLDEILVEPFSS